MAAKSVEKVEVCSPGKILFIATVYTHLAAFTFHLFGYSSDVDMPSMLQHLLKKEGWIKLPHLE